MTHEELHQKILAVRKIVGIPYERYYGGTAHRNLYHRLLLITIPGARMFASHAFFTLEGSPTRGSVVVSLDGHFFENRHVTTGRRLTERDVKTLTGFVGIVAKTCFRRVPLGFSWASETPDPDA